MNIFLSETNLSLTTIPQPNAAMRKHHLAGGVAGLSLFLWLTSCTLPVLAHFQPSHQIGRPGNREGAAARIYHSDVR